MPAVRRFTSPCRRRGILPPRGQTSQARISICTYVVISVEQHGPSTGAPHGVCFAPEEPLLLLLAVAP